MIVPEVEYCNPAWTSAFLYYISLDSEAPLKHYYYYLCLQHNYHEDLYYM